VICDGQTGTTDILCQYHFTTTSLILWQFATRWKVAGSFPYGVIRIFHSHNTFGRTMTLGSTDPLTEMSKGKGKVHPITGHEAPKVE
jgi:hypothetical protein